jgi:hypothetical protein
VHLLDPNHLDPLSNSLTNNLFTASGLSKYTVLRKRVSSGEPESWARRLTMVTGVLYRVQP